MQEDDLKQFIDTGSDFGDSPTAPMSLQSLHQLGHPQGTVVGQSSSPPQQQQKWDVQGCRSTDLKVRACDECRKRKTACYILENSTKCFRCKMEDVDCTFTAGATKKSNQQKPLVQPKNKQQSLLEDYSNLPNKSLLKRTLSLQHPRSSFTVADTTLFDSTVLNTVALDKNNQAQLSPNLSLRRVSPDTLFIVRSDSGSTQWVSESEEIERAVSPYGWALVNCYFQYCQPVNPILHEKVFIEKYQRNFHEITPSLLGAVYCLGLKWWYHSNDLCTTVRPGNLHGILYQLATSSFFAASGRPNVSLMQSGLLLMQCANSDSQTMAISSVITNLAFRLSLNTNCMTWKLPKWERMLRVRLAWAVFGQNKWVSLQESLPSQIDTENNWELTPVSDDLFELDGMQSPLVALYSFQCNLSTIMNDIHNLIFKAPADPTLEDLLLRVKPIQMNLRRFHQDLHAELGLGPTSSRDPTQESTQTANASQNAQNPREPSSIQLAGFSLQLSYISAEITLHRHIITKIHNGIPVTDPQLAEICRAVAESRLNAAVELIMGMQSLHVQNLFTFNAANNFALIGVFAALMQIITTDMDKRQRYSSLLKSYIAVLKLFSEHDVISSAIRHLSSSIAGVTDLM